ncbi:MAG TPA: hypothetical protein VMG35_19160 [Bryobacteraceae bacterium]|nr:hypothetical protein [Bryobacteraceae bacterium]
MKENCDHRVLGGFQCVDAITKQSVVDPLNVASSQLLLRPNRSGVYAVWDAPNLRKYTAFDPLLPWPDPADFEITIEDPSLRYLPRRGNIKVPQPLPVSPASPTPPFTASSSQAIAYGPQPVPLYRGPAAPVAPNWAVVRASVVNDAKPPVRLRWAVLQVLSGATVLATGMADLNGEALLAVPGLGLQVSSNSGGPVTEVTTSATVQAWYDPTILSQPISWVPNPDDILLHLPGSFKTATATIQFGPGQTVNVPLTVSM